MATQRLAPVLLVLGLLSLPRFTMIARADAVAELKSEYEYRDAEYE